MKLPEIDLTHANVWQSPLTPCESPLRFVTRYEVELCLTSGSASSIDEERRELENGMMIFARPGQIRHSRFPFRNAFVYFHTQPHAGFDALLARVPPFSPPDERRADLMNRLLTAFRAQNQLLAAALLIELLEALAQSAPIPRREPLLPGQAEIFRAICYMRENLHRRPDIAELAARAGYSPSHFTARFRQLTHATPYEYFQGLRLREAKRLLACEDVSVSQAAQELAFSSASHFCQSFRQHFGLTPTQWLRENRHETGYEI